MHPFQVFIVMTVSPGQSVQPAPTESPFHSYRLPMLHRLDTAWCRRSGSCDRTDEVLLTAAGRLHYECHGHGPHGGRAARSPSRLQAQIIRQQCANCDRSTLRFPSLRSLGALRRCNPPQKRRMHRPRQGMGRNPNATLVLDFYVPKIEAWMLRGAHGGNARRTRRRHT
jgi:hypothetical protein